MNENAPKAANDAHMCTAVCENNGISKIKQLARWLSARAQNARSVVTLHTLVRILSHGKKGHVDKK